MQKRLQVLLAVAMVALGCAAIPAAASADDISISPTTLPDAYAGESYNVQLTANPAPGVTLGFLEWTITAGSLPDGMFLDRYHGTIAGSADISEQDQLTVTVTDDAGHTGSQAYNLNVAVDTSSPQGISLAANGAKHYALAHSGCVGLLIVEILAGTSKHC
jgi:hypothetical protein